ncbi:MAG: Nramp family divalent metal transporter, partial [Mycoplasmatales bacterium]
AGSDFGYSLLWVVLLSTIILIILQYNVAKFGIITGTCIAEGANKKFSSPVAKIILGSAMLAIIATVLAELLGAAIAIQMIFNLPIKVGVVIAAIVTLGLVFSNKYNKIEGIIIGFVSLIGISFLVELLLAPVMWSESAIGLIPTIPQGSIVIIMGIMGAVVMPHNLFLHSEFIQSRKYDTKNKKELKKQLKYAKTDTLISMIVGFAINSAMIILAASTFFVAGISVTSLEQANQMLEPLLGSTSAGIFALALLFAGIASSITAAMSGGVISSGFFNEKYNSNDRHTSFGIVLVVLVAAIMIFFVDDPFMGLIISQVFLSIQLPITIITQIFLTSDKKLMQSHANDKKDKILLWSCAIIVIVLNIILLIGLIKG